MCSSFYKKGVCEIETVFFCSISDMITKNQIYGLIIGVTCDPILQNESEVATANT